MQYCDTYSEVGPNCKKLRILLLNIERDTLRIHQHHDHRVGVTVNRYLTMRREI